MQDASRTLLLHRSRDSSPGSKLVLGAMMYVEHAAVILARLSSGDSCGVIGFGCFRLYGFMCIRCRVCRPWSVGRCARCEKKLRPIFLHCPTMPVPPPHRRARRWLAVGARVAQSVSRHCADSFLKSVSQRLV